MRTVPATCLLLCVMALGTSGRAAEGLPEDAFRPDRFDAAPFGFAERAPDGKSYGIRWGEPRKVRTVVVEFAPGTRPDPDALRVEYWHRVWDGRPDPILAERGAGGVGWAAMDDWTNGNWKRADTRVRAEGERVVFTFAPTGASEFKDLGEEGVGYRKTLKLRVAADAPLPAVTRLRAITDSVTRPLTCRIFFGKPALAAIVPKPIDNGRLEIFNGTVTAVRSLDGGSLTVAEDMRWRLPAQAEGGLEADILMAVDAADSRYDRTVVTVRAKNRSFSFAADEVARGERILVDDLGVLVVRGDDPATLEAYRRQRREFPGRTVYDRVHEEREQTLSRAWNDMPLKRPLYFVHGLPHDRNTMRQQPNGDVDVTAVRRWFNIHRSAKDSERKLWGPEFITCQFGLPADHLRGGRELREGYLPELRTWWQDGPIHYEQTTILDKLDGDLSRIALDDPTVLLMRIRVVNVSATKSATARLHLRTGGERVFLQDDLVTAVWKDQPRIRFLFDCRGKGRTADDEGVRWSLELTPGQSHDVYLAIPSITISEDEAAALRRRNFEADADRICAFWREITARGAQIETPEPWLNDFYKAHVRHLLVNCFGEIGSDRLHAHVGTFHYGVYPNESVMMISDLDRRGYHDEARRCLDAFLHYQGTVGFMGNYRSIEGEFYGAGGHETGNYNKSHGYVMWNMAEHWWNTRDREWMARAAPKLVKACEWVIRERQATMTKTETGGRPIEYGFLPAGSLEDVTDYWYWLATNSATVWGFRNLAAALADYGHPEGDRLIREAQAYYDDFMRGMTRARIRTPVVRLRDGTYVPKFPSRLYERGRCHGWLRETLEGAIFLVHYGLVPADSPEATWILKDYEDNLYISEDYGYAIPAFDQFWFSRGGFSMQAQLLDGPPPYLYRDDVKHYLRAYFNGFASAFYPEIRMCNEHSLPELGYPRGDHFKSSDEAQSTFWLRLMFVREEGDCLYLGQAIPRYWLADGRQVAIERAATHFGPLSLRITSQVAKGRITARLSPPQRTPPKTIYLRLRHPDGKPIRSITVNGKAHDRFDVKKEWVILPGRIEQDQEIVAQY